MEPYKNTKTLKEEIKETIRIIRVWWLKQRLKSAYLNYMDKFESYTCGAALASHISTSITKDREKVNKIIRKLKVLDPECQLNELN